MSALSFRVGGRPAPQGSKRYVGNGRTVESSRALRPWREAVRSTAVAAIAANDGDWVPLREPVEVTVTFWLPRPRSHYRANGELRDTAPDAVTTRPDLDKLTRAVLDALTDAGVLADDSYATDLACRKRYADYATGADVTIRPIT